MARDNPCHYRYAGCAGAVTKGARCCESCRIEHNQREAERREARRQAQQCIKCGKPAAKTKQVLAGPKGKQRTVRQPSVYCSACLSYYAERAT